MVQDSVYLWVRRKIRFNFRVPKKKKKEDFFDELSNYFL